MLAQKLPSPKAAVPLGPSVVATPLPRGAGLGGAFQVATADASLVFKLAGARTRPTASEFCSALAATRVVSMGTPSRCRTKPRFRAGKTLGTAPHTCEVAWTTAPGSYDFEAGRVIDQLRVEVERLSTAVTRSNTNAELASAHARVRELEEELDAERQAAGECKLELEARIAELQTSADADMFFTCDDGENQVSTDDTLSAKGTGRAGGRACNCSKGVRGGQPLALRPRAR